MTRARHLGLLAGAALLGCTSAILPAPTADARPGVRQRATAPLVVDVARLRAAGLGPTADLIERAMLAEFAGVARPGATLLVRVEALSLNSYAGGGGGGGSGGGGGGGGGNSGTTNDFLEGEALLIGPGGEVLSRRRQVLALPSSSGGPYYLPGSETRRVIKLARTFANWIKRDLA